MNDTRSARLFIGLLGFLFLIFGISALLHGVVGLMNAEPLTVITIGNISEMINVQNISERDFTLLMAFNTVIGIFFIFIGNSLLYHATKEKMFHPRCGDIMDMCKMCMNNGKGN